ncbi:hypothetical protein [Nocardiopsis metallicus]|uniref:hypothetical protein n=1 Tax=Nocardiopsis metallicus TaxID=179819 RepID=UPI001C855515|nr:hypothetical protein [Nocardiopsis metallicus]
MTEEEQRVERRGRLGPPVFGDRWGGVLNALLLTALLTLTIGGGVFGVALSGTVLFPDGVVGRAPRSGFRGARDGR